jgi:RNA polymerase sigma-70 factor (ECF subfamily)
MAQAASEDQDLLRQIAKGNAAAFDLCYQRYHGPIYRFAWHMTGAQAIAEEVTQEVFLRLIRNPRSFDPARGSLAGYLFGMARNVMRGQLAATAQHVPLEDEAVEHIAAAPGGDADLLFDIDRQEKLDLLRRSVLALPEPYREAVVLCELEELSYPEAAAILGCPPGTVASRLHRARTMLKARFRAMGCLR